MRAVRASRAIPCEKEHRPRKEEIISEEQMPISYFSEREEGPKPRVNERITEPAWGGIVAAIITRIEDNSLGIAFPYSVLMEEESQGVTGNFLLSQLKAKSPIFFGHLIMTKYHAPLPFLISWSFATGLLQKQSKVTTTRFLGILISALNQKRGNSYSGRISTTFSHETG
jgi:hypothetical protein